MTIWRNFHFDHWLLKHDSLTKCLWNHERIHSRHCRMCGNFFWNIVFRSLDFFAKFIWKDEFSFQFIIFILEGLPNDVKEIGDANWFQKDFFSHAKQVASSFDFVHKKLREITSLLHTKFFENWDSKQTFLFVLKFVYKNKLSAIFKMFEINSSKNVIFHQIWNFFLWNLYTNCLKILKIPQVFVLNVLNQVLTS